MIFTIQDFFNEYWTWFLDAYLILFVIALVLSYAFKNKRAAVKASREAAKKKVVNKVPGK